GQSGRWYQASKVPVSVLAAHQLDETEQGKTDEGQQGAFSNAQAEEGPGDLGAIRRSAEQQGEHLQHRQYIDHVIQAGQARGQLIRRLVLQPDLATGGGGTEGGEQGHAHGVGTGGNGAVATRTGLGV